MSKNKSRDSLLVRDGDDVVFPNNGLLAELCGQFDKNLAYIENNIETSLSRRGNIVTASGDEKELGLEILDVLYKRLNDGKQVSLTEIDSILKNQKKYKVSGEKFQNFTIKTRKKIVEPRTISQSKYIQSFEKSELVFGIGPAGTGKTYIAVAMAASRFIEGHVDRIILSRPAVEAGERLGFLPGDMKDKVDPYMQPLYDALKEMIATEKLDDYLKRGIIEIAPLAYMRGRTLDNAFVILDEGQNTTHNQMKMFLTRMGNNAKFMINGDPGQIDLPRRVISGLKEANLILKNVEGIKMIYLDDSDVIRHQVVKRIIEAYKNSEHTN